MLGPKQEAQGALFYEFSIEDHVPQDHLLRSIDRFVDLSGIRQHLAQFYSYTGRPSVDPELLIRMLLVGYCFGIRSERRLCEEVHLNLAYRWFCRFDLADRVPDHSTFSKNRHGRFRESKVLRHLFETTVARCIAEGLVSGQRMSWRVSISLEADFCIDALEEALARHGKPEIFNTDQGSQFTSVDFIKVLASREIKISMDGKGAWRDNVFVERLWRTIKYEEVYLHAYANVPEARASIRRYIDFYNGRRPHSSLDGKTPDRAYFNPLTPVSVAA